MSADDILKDTTIGFVGAGNMAKAIGIGLINSGKVKASNVIVSAPSENNFGVWRDAGAKVTHINMDVFKVSRIIFISVKPQYFDSMMFSIAKNDPQLLFGKIVVSIMAGITIERLLEAFKFASGCTFIRVMPNTPISVGAGCSVLSHLPESDKSDVDLVKAIMEVGGICEIVPESLFSAYGALCGSGPAFMFLVIESMADAAVKLGIPRAFALKFAEQTMMGSASLALQSGHHPGVLKDAVCSPGGTTICGMHELERGMVRASFMNAIEAAAKRSQELSKQ